MASLVEDWKDVEEYAQQCRYGYYQTREDVDGIEIRVLVGRLGYIHVFEKNDDTQLKRIIHFCKTKEFIKVLGNIPDEIFFPSH